MRIILPAWLKIAAKLKKPIQRGTRRSACPVGWWMTHQPLGFYSVANYNVRKAKVKDRPPPGNLSEHGPR
jgi:hypothetical protein